MGQELGEAVDQMVEKLVGDVNRQCGQVRDRGAGGVADPE